MKYFKQLPFVLTILFLFPAFGYTQGNDYYVEVKTSVDSLKPHPDSINRSNSKMLNSIFESYGVLEYFQTYEGMKNPEALKFYEIHLEGNIQAFVNVLDSLAIFEIVNLYPYPTMLCANPVPYNDPFIIPYLGWGGWTHQIDNIEAECAWSITEGDPNVVVAVVDNEFDTNHEDMIGKFVYIDLPRHILMEETLALMVQK